MNPTKPVIRFSLLLLFTLLVCEVTLRLFGYSPTVQGWHGDVGGGYAPDPITGWKNRPGQRVSSSRDSSSSTFPSPTFRYTIWDSGSRATREVEAQKNPENLEQVSSKKKLIFLGGSFTQGGGVDDRETFPWLTQSAFPELEVENFGTGGYGTCQSFLRMRALLQSPEYQNAIVIYGSNDFHEPRNVGHPLYSWRLARASLQRTAHMPYCGLGEKGQLTVHPPQVFYFQVPWSTSLSVARLIEESYYAITGSWRASNQRQVTEELFLQMKQITSERNGRFIVLIQRHNQASRTSYLEFLKAHEIEFIDGSHPDQDSPSMQLQGDYHPNARMNKYWADKIVEYLRQSSIP